MQGIPEIDKENRRVAIKFFVDPGTWSYGIAKLDGEFAVDGKVIDSDGNHRLDGGSHLPESGM